jgi:hypothetical protein
MAEPIQYREALVTFIDILGFRGLVKENAAATINNVLETLQCAASEHSVQTDERDAEDDPGAGTSFAFSDSIVRVRPYDRAPGEGAVFAELFFLALTQGELAFEGIFVRGGVTIGEIYFENNKLFGPALVRAYDIERKAKYPRIVIDKKVMEEYERDSRLRASHHSFAHDKWYVKSLMYRNFVDYLPVSIGEMEFDIDRDNALVEHARYIKAAISAATKRDVRMKYKWLVRYHNAALKRIFRRGKVPPDLFIDVH